MSLEEPADVALRRLCTSDLYLACACSRGEPDAFFAFEQQCLAVVDGALRRLRGDADLVAEVKQRLRESLLVADKEPPKIALYAGRGLLRDWLRVSALREGFAATLLKDTRAGLSKRLQIHPRDLDSILGLIRSRIDVSLRTLFRRRGRSLVPNER